MRLFVAFRSNTALNRALRWDEKQVSQENNATQKSFNQVNRVFVPHDLQTRIHAPDEFHLWIIIHLAFASAIFSFLTIKMHISQAWPEGACAWLTRFPVLPRLDYATHLLVSPKQNKNSTDPNSSKHQEKVREWVRKKWEEMTKI